MPATRPRRLVLPFLVALFACLAGRAGAQSPAGVHEALRARVEQLRESPTPTVRGERLWQPAAVATFFEMHGFAPAWTPAGAGAVVDAIRHVDADGLTPAHYHLAAIEQATAAGAASPDAQAEAQLLLTDAVAAIVDHVRYGKAEPAALDARWNVDPRLAAPPLETVIEQVATADSPAAAIDSFKPTHFVYAGLKQALARLRALQDAGGWPTVPAGDGIRPGAGIKPGTADARVRAIRARLAATGELEPGTPLGSEAYDADLEAAVKRFQERNRLTADGVIGQGTVDAMNVAVATRIDQVRVNMDRARWVLGGLRDSFVLVNLPAFKVYVIKDRQNVWETRAQVGKQARQTPAFRADMRYIVLNPDWTVPPTILAQDVLAAMKRGDNAIKRKRLTVLDRHGNPVDPASIDWAKATPGNFPYTLRQPPGPDNALGRVKFMFPNEHSIFLHDTPSRELFAADQRTFSSGCIRVEKPLDLAAVLLQDTGTWTRERIQQVVDSGQPETVLLPQPLPVLIVYWTVSVGASGDLHFARDVYALDAGVKTALDRR